MMHLPRKGTGPDLVAVCDRYTAEAIGGMEDERRDRFTTDESVIFNAATGCSFCREALIEGSRHDVPPPQAWAHPDIVERSIRGDLDDGPRPWPTWRSALRSYVSWQDSGASLRSSSDPGRFEAVPSGSSGPPQGDQGQRQAERFSRVGEAIAATFPAGFVVRTSPERNVLFPAECMQIVVAIVAGRDVDARTGGQGRWTKQRLRVRLPIADEPHVAVEERRSPHAIVAAMVTESVGFVVTAGHVGAIERQAGREIQGLLKSRGLVLHDDTRLEEREAEVVNKQRLLRGLRAISEHTGWSIRRVLNAREWVPPIPLRREGEEWVGDADEIDEWRKAGPVAPSGESAA